MTKKDDTTSPLAKRVEELESLVEGLQAEAETAKEGQARALADLENFRRRQAEAQAGWSTAAVSSFCKKMLPNLLELSLGAAHSADEMAKTTIGKFFTDLEKLGFVKIEPAPGDPIDANLHEVLLAADGKPGTIVQCLEIGWKFQDQIIAPAKVSAATQ